MGFAYCRHWNFYLITAFFYHCAVDSLAIEQDSHVRTPVKVLYIHDQRLEALSVCFYLISGTFNISHEYS